MRSTLSNSEYLGDRKSVRIEKFSITEIRIIEIICSEIFKGAEHFVRSSKGSNYTSSD